MLIALTALVFLLLGREVSLPLFSSDDTSPIERACYAAVIGLTLWLSTLWIVALLHLMIKSVLLARTVIAAVVAIWLFVKRSPRGAIIRDIRLPAMTVAALAFGVLPMGLWCEFVLWRGTIMPPSSHDALAYHLPKAVLYARAHGYAYFDFLDARIRNIPANYEMLLSETMIVTGSDALTEWISALLYVLWVVASAALARRWWKSDWWTTIAVSIFAAGVPVALLHSGADKNDLMTAFFMVAALVAAGRWTAIADIRALIVLVPALAIAIGTKPQAGILAICLAPFVLWRLLRPTVQLKRIAVLTVASLVALLLLGGAVYVSNLTTARRLMGESAEVKNKGLVRYGDWSNLWQGPYVLLAAPFSRTPRALTVPWAERPWFWRRYEIFFSDLGIPFAICAVLLPIAILLARRREDGFPVERVSVTLAAFATFLIMLPVRFEPHGMYSISLPRYVLFLVPVVLAWTVGAFVSRAKPAVSLTVIAVGAAFFVWYAVDLVVNDVFAPLHHVMWARERPGNRIVRFDPLRAPEIVDAFAGARDRIAVDASFSSWLHPLFGVDLQRPVDFIPPGEGPPVIGDDVKWVVVDRSWNQIWGDPNFRDLSQAPQFLTRGMPRPEDVRVLNALRSDSRFRLVFYNSRTNQAVFQRIR